MIRLEHQVILAVVLDLLLGDPRWLPHPVRLMGRLIAAAETLVRRHLPDSRASGAVLAASVVALCAGCTWSVLRLASWIHPLVGDVVGILLIYLSLAARDMVHHSEAVHRCLADGNLSGARGAVGMIVGREVEALDEGGVCRATVESVAENLVDGVLSPLLFAVLAGAVGAVAFKAVSTLDSTVGYKNQQYLKLGWASARLDDLANFLPARLSPLLVAAAARLLRYGAGRSLSVCRRDRRRHASPNSAWAQAAFAGALGIQLGGPVIYEGETVSRPTIGDTCQAIGPAHIRRADILFIATTLIASIVFLAVSLTIRGPTVGAST